MKLRLFRRKPEIRADSEPHRYAEDTALLTFFASEDIITKAQALEIPTVSACVQKIAETVSRLPVKLYRRDSDKVTEITDDSRIKLLNGETGDTLTSVDMWRSAIEDYYLGRGAWIYVDSDGINVRGLHYVDDRDISIMRSNDPIFKAFNVIVGRKSYFDFRFIRLMRKTRNGYDNIPIQSENPKLLWAVYNAIKLESAMNSSGCKSGIFKAKNRLTDDAMKAIRKSYESLYGESRKKELLVLNEGVDFQEISATAAELQLNENKRANSTEICKLFGFPHTIIDGGASENDRKEFISVIASLINQIETALDAALLLESEKEEGFYWAFDTKELTRGSMLERFQAYEIARRNNFLQTDEIRREEDYEPLGFNFINLGLGDVLLNPQNMEVFTPNTGQTSKLGEIRAGDQPRDKLGRFASTGGGGVVNPEKKLDKPRDDGIIRGKGKPKKDFNGNPYTYPELRLPKKEYGKVIKGIDDTYEVKYKGKEKSVYFTPYATYFFEIRGYNDYNIYGKREG